MATARKTAAPRKTAAKTTTATATDTTQSDVERVKNAVAVKDNAALATTADIGLFEQDAGAGLDNADNESFAIPFIKVLQKLSPELSSKTGIEGADEGMLYNTATGILTDGEKGMIIIPVHYRRVFLHFQARANGGGFKGEYSVEDAIKMKEEGKVVELDGRHYFPLPDGSVSDKKSDVFTDTRMHYILVVDPETGVPTPAIISLSGSQVKKSKMLNTGLNNIKLKGGKGLFTPPTFANKVKVRTVPESNDQGEWFGVSFHIEGQLAGDEAQIYKIAKDFYETVRAGQVQAKYDDIAPGAIDEEENDRI